MRELDIICLPCTRSVTVSVDRFHGVREFAFLQRTLFNAIFDAQCIRKTHDAYMERKCAENYNK